MLQSEPQSSEHWLHALQHVHQANTSAYFCAAKGVRKALVWLRTSAKLESRSALAVLACECVIPTSMVELTRCDIPERLCMPEASQVAPISN